MANYILQICPETDEIFELYKNHNKIYIGDMGIDLIIPHDYIIKYNESDILIDYGIKCRVIDKITKNDIGYYIYPRSSIYKTPLFMTNSIGVIDSKYRGNLKSPFNFKICGYKLDTYKIEKGTRLTQIVINNIGNFEIEIVKELDKTDRGEKGFGSSG